MNKLTIAELLKDGLFIDGDWIESKDQDPSGDVRLIQLADIGDGVFRDKSARFLTLTKARELRCTFLEAGDILLARMPEPLGRACIFPGVGQSAVTAVDVCIIRPSAARVRADWLVKAINSPDFRETMQQFIRGTTRQRISRKNLGTLSLEVPALPEQARISGIVDNLESRRGSSAAHLGVARRTVKRFRQAVLAAACSGRLTADWREEHPDTQSVEAALAGLVAGRKRQRLAGESIDLPMQALPEGYIIGTIRAAAVLIQYGTSQRSDANIEGIPVLRMGNIQDGSLDLSDLKYCVADHEIEKLMLRDGDLLFNRTNSPELVGKTAVFHQDARMTFASYLIRVRFDAEVADPDFVGYWINSSWGKAWARHVKTDGVSQSNINGTKLGAMPLPLPPIEEQREIVRRASKMLQLADNLLVQIQSVLRYVDRSSQAVLAKAFRGELHTNDVSESAEVL